MKGPKASKRGLRASWRGLRANWMGLRVNWVGLRATHQGLRASHRGNGWTNGRTDKQNFFAFYRTLSPVGAAAQKERDRQTHRARQTEREGEIE